MKHRADRTIERHKAWFVENGYTQLVRIDYLDTFSLVAKLITIRFLLAIDTVKNWHLHQLDIDNAFMHEDLNEQVYIYPPRLITWKHNKFVDLQRL